MIRFKLSEEERRCPNTVIMAVMETMHHYGQARLDCKHTAILGFDNEVTLEQGEDGLFRAICLDCTKLEGKEKPIEPKNIPYNRSGFC